MNTKKLGDQALAHAISYFGHQGQTVSLPLTDSQDYDLVAEIDGKLKKVQVKKAGYTRNGTSYIVEIVLRGGTNGGVYKKKEDFDFDLLFAWTGDGTCFLVPIDKLNGCTTLDSRFDEYKVWQIGKNIGVVDH